jgi:hypothetical protein
MPLANPAERLLDDAMVGVVLRPDLILAGRNSEQEDSLNSQRAYPVDLLVEHLVDRELKHLGHGRDLALDCAPVHHKEGLDEIGRRKFVFPDELTDGTGSAPSSGSVAEREGHKGRLESGRPARNSSQRLHCLWHVPCPYKERRTRGHVSTLSIRRAYIRKATGRRQRPDVQVNG